MPPNTTSPALPFLTSLLVISYEYSTPSVSQLKLILLLTLVMVGVAHFSASINGTLVSKLFHGSEELYESIEFEGMHKVADSIYEFAKAPALVLGTDLAKQVTLLILGQEPKALLSILLVFFSQSDLCQVSAAQKRFRAYRF